MVPKTHQDNDNGNDNNNNKKGMEELATEENNDNDNDNDTTFHYYYYYYYLKSPQARKNIINYHYHGSDKSLTYKYLLSPLAEWCCVHFCSPTMAPNTITLIGLCGMMSCYVLYWWYVPGIYFLQDNDIDIDIDDEYFPRWICLYNALWMLMYQTLDNMDGKQARRTKSSSALGLLFDHGCDAWNSIIGSTNWIINMQLLLLDDDNNNLIPIWILVLGPMAMFYVTTWEHFMTGQLILPMVNGPNEGLIMGAMLSFTSWYYGPSIWQQPLDNEPWLLQQDWIHPIFSVILPNTSSSSSSSWKYCHVIVVLFCLGALQEVIVKIIGVLWQCQHRKRQRQTQQQQQQPNEETKQQHPHQHQPSIFDAICGLIPFMTMVGLLFVGMGMITTTTTTMTTTNNNNNVFITCPRTTFHLVTVLFVEMSTQCMLDHIILGAAPNNNNNDPSSSSSLDFLMGRLVLQLPWMIWIMTTVSSSSLSLQYYDELFLTLYTTALTMYVCFKMYRVIQEICHVLKIWCFDIVTPYYSDYHDTTPTTTTTNTTTKKKN